MGDNSRCSDEHWEPKKWEGWPAFLCVGKETSYAHRQWNHSPAQILLSCICLRTQRPFQWNNWEFFHSGSGQPGVGSAAAGHGTGCAGGGQGSRKWAHLTFTAHTRRLLGEHGALHLKHYVSFTSLHLPYRSHLQTKASGSSFAWWQVSVAVSPWSWTGQPIHLNQWNNSQKHCPSRVSVTRQ